jgi:hypothetical protein
VLKELRRLGGEIRLPVAHVRNWTPTEI